MKPHACGEMQVEQSRHGDFCLGVWNERVRYLRQLKNVCPGTVKRNHPERILSDMITPSIAVSLEDLLF